MDEQIKNQIDTLYKQLEVSRESISAGNLQPAAAMLRYLSEDARALADAIDGPPPAEEPALCCIGNGINQAA